MASITLGSRFKVAPFICDSCLSKYRPLSKSHSSTSNNLRKPAFATFITTSERIPLRTSRKSTGSEASLQIAIQHARHLGFYQSYSRSASVLRTQLAQKALAPLPHRRLISLTGPDAAKFLQGLVTNNVTPISTHPFYSAFLDARGRVLWDIFIWAFVQKGVWGCYIEVDANEVESVVWHLRKHKLRSKIEIRVIDESELRVWAAWGIEREMLSEEPVVANLEDPRAEGMGYRALMHGTPKEDRVQIVETKQYHIRRYLHGVPEGQNEIAKESALPMECNIDLSNGIDFKKGCYVGQELTIRTKHTGVVRKRILPVQLYNTGHSTPPDDAQAQFDPSWEGEVIEGADIKQLDEDGSIKKGRAAGKFIAGIGNIGLALCRLEMMTPMRVSAEGGTYRPGAEFGLQSEESSTKHPVRIKAIVPQWFKERESALWDKGRQKLASS